MKQRHKIDYQMPQQKVTPKKIYFIMDNTPEGLMKDKALLDAFMKEDVEKVKQLLQYQNGVRGANPNVKDEHGRTLYHLARRWGWSEMKGILHQHGGKIEHNPNAVHYVAHTSKKIRVRS